MSSCGRLGALRCVFATRKLGGVDLEDTFVLLKQMVEEFPLLVAPAGYVIVAFLTAYAMMCFERWVHLSSCLSS